MGKISRNNVLDSNTKKNLKQSDWEFKPLVLKSAPFFSIIIPTYNQAEYLPMALQSLLDQTYSNWEAVIVNDGSTDNTKEVLQQYSSLDSRFSFYTKENGGAGSALNEALKHVRGEWICWLSSDDFFDKDKLKNHFDEILKAPGIKFFYSHYYILNEEEQVVYSPDYNSQTGFYISPYQVLGFFNGNYIHGLSVTIHRDVFTEVGVFNENYKYAQDYDLWLRIVSKFEARYIDFRTVVTRVYPKQITTAFPEWGILDSTRAAIEFINTRTFQEFFPRLILNNLENIIYAVEQTIYLSLDKEIFLYKGSFSSALLDKLREWLFYSCPEELKTQINNRIAVLVDTIRELGFDKNLPPSIKKAIQNLKNAATKSFKYLPHDFIQEIVNANKAGNNKEKIELYLQKAIDKKNNYLKIKEYLPEVSFEEDEAGCEAQIKATQLNIKEEKTTLNILVTPSNGENYIINREINIAEELKTFSFNEPKTHNKLYISPKTIFHSWKNNYDFIRSFNNLSKILNERKNPTIAFTVIDGHVRGGGTIELYKFADWFSQMGYEVTIYSNSVKPKWLKINHKYIIEKDNLARYAAIKEDIIISYSINELPIILRECNCQSKLVFHLCQGIETFHNSNKTVSSLLCEKPYFKLLHNLPVGRITVSNSIDKYFKNTFNQKTFLIQNGIGNKYISYFPKRKDYFKKTVNFLFIGNPNFYLKGLEVLGKAIGTIAKKTNQNKNFELTLIDGSINHNISDDFFGIKIKYKNCSSVECMIKEYEKAHIYINASLYEGFGLPTLEAMAIGTPVIQSDNQGLDGIIKDGENCLIFPPGDYKALAQKIELLLSDEALRNKLIENGKRTSNNFSELAQRVNFEREFSKLFNALKNNVVENEQNINIKNKKSKIKILYVAHSYPPNWYAGVENYLKSFVDTISRNDEFEVSVLIPVINGNNQNISISKTIIENYVLYNFCHNIAQPVLTDVHFNDFEKILEEFFKKNNFDIVHFHHVMNFPIKIISIAKKYSKKVIFTFHDYWLFCPQAHLFNKKKNQVCLGNKLAKECAECIFGNDSFLIDIIENRKQLVNSVLMDIDYFTTPSQYVKKRISEFGVSNKIFVHPLGINNDLNVLKKQSIVNEDLTFGYMGSIAKIKNIENIAKWFTIFKHSAKLKIWGNGHPELINNIKEIANNSNNITYLGAYLPNDLPSIFSQIDVLIIPSFNETYSLVLREAFSFQVPVLVSDIEVFKEIVVNNFNGLTFNPLSFEDFKDKLIFLEQNPNKILEMRKNISPMISIYEDVLMWEKVYDKFSHKLTVPEKFVSVIIVTYNSSKIIRNCLTSVLQTKRENDEVIIVDNASSDTTLSILREFDSEEKVKVIVNKENLGFSKAVNQGIKNSGCAFVCLLNPDTLVYKGWLEKMIFHFDKPSVGAVGPLSNYVAGLQNISAHIKDNEDIDLENFESDMLVGDKRFLNTKLLIGFCIMLRRDVLDIELNGLDENLYLGNDDLDLSWRLRLAGYQLKIALDVFVLHEGQHSFKTVSKIKTDKLVQESTDALYCKLEKYYGKGNVPNPINLWGMNWFKPANAQFNSKINIQDVIYEDENEGVINRYFKFIKTSIIIPVYNQHDYTIQMLNSVSENTKVDYELIFIDNNSNAETKIVFNELEKVQNVKVIHNATNQGFPIAINQGIKEATGDYILIANNDIVVTKGWLKKLLKVAEVDSQIGIVGVVSNSVSGVQQVENADYNSIDEMHKYAEKIALENKSKILAFPRVAFLCTLIKREVIEKIGGLDERFSPGNYEDDDFCLRAQLAGFKTVIAQEVFIHHYGSKSFKANGENQYSKLLETNKQKFIDKWGATPDDIWLHGKNIKSGSSRIELYYPIKKESAEVIFNKALEMINKEEYESALKYLNECITLLSQSSKFNIEIEKVMALRNKVEQIIITKKET